MDPVLILKNASTINAFVRGAGEGDCVLLLAAERAGRARKRLMLRIHSRLNRVRADRERAEILACARR